jgi:hypothetical protein
MVMSWGNESRKIEEAVRIIDARRANAGCARAEGSHSLNQLRERIVPFMFKRSVDCVRNEPVILTAVLIVPDDLSLIVDAGGIGERA